MPKNKIYLIGAGVSAWLFFSLYPWQAGLEKFPILRFALALLIYIIPGALTFLYLSENKNISARILLGGFAVSIFATGLLGVLARFFHLNFSFIRWGFALWGVAVLILFFVQNRQVNWRFEKNSRLEIFLLALAAGCVLYFAVIARPPLIHDDAFTYNALLYYYQHAPALDFNFFPSLERMEIPRFWIAYWPLVEALISDLSRVDGLIVAGAYLPFALACFSFMGIYSLGLTLGLPRALAGAAVIAQGFSLMRLSGFNQPGNLFFQRLTEDKAAAAFVISLIFILLVAEYLEYPGKSKLILAGIIALEMVFTHPVQFGMACMITGVYGLPALFNKSLRGKYLALIGVLALIVMIPYLFRFGGGEYSQTLSFSLSDVARNNDYDRFGGRVDVVDGTQFYGISRSITPGLPYQAGLAAAVVSLFFFWRHKFARYILAAFLVLGLSMIPYTGWIVGMFTTPFQLWRLTWLMPFGMAFAFLFWAGFEIIQKVKFLQQQGKWINSMFYLSVYAALIAAVVYVRPWAMSNVETRNLDEVEIYNNYISTAKLMNQLDVESPVILGGPDATTNSIIPSLTMKYNPLVFRVQSGGGHRRLWLSLMGEDIPLEERYARLLENKVEYLLIKGEPDWLTDLLMEYPKNIELVFKDQRFRLYKLTP